MAKPKIVLDSKGVKALLSEPGVLAFLTAEAEKVLAAAQSSAPVDSGAYKESLEVRARVEGRAVARVVSTSPYGYVIEARTGNLARALNAAGGS